MRKASFGITFFLDLFCYSPKNFLPVLIFPRIVKDEAGLLINYYSTKVMFFYDKSHVFRRVKLINLRCNIVIKQYNPLSLHYV